MTRAPVVAGFPVSHPTKNLMEVKCHEGKTVCKADLREVQDHPPQGQGYGYLPEPEAQAEAGLKGLTAFIGDFKSPLYTKLGSEDTKFRYPNGAAQGGWIGESKARAKLALLMKTAWPFSDCMRRTARKCEAGFLPFPDK